MNNVEMHDLGRDLLTLGTGDLAARHEIEGHKRGSGSRRTRHSQREVFDKYGLRRGRRPVDLAERVERKFSHISDMRGDSKARGRTKTYPL